MDFGKFGLLLSKNAVLLNGRANSSKQVFIVHGLGKEITSPVFHRLHALWNIAGTGQKDNGQETACFLQEVLEFEAI